MLTLLMLILSDPAATPPPVMIDRPAARVVPFVEACSDPLMQAEQRTGDRTPLSLDRSLDDGQARRYLLLDRRDRNNCPLPISFAVPDQPRALGREFGPSVSTSSSPPLRPGF